MIPYQLICNFFFYALPFSFLIYFINIYSSKKIQYSVLFCITIFYFVIIKILGHYYNFTYLNFIIIFIFLFIYGTVVLKNNRIETLSISTLLLTMLFLSKGITSMIGYYILKEITLDYILRSLDLWLAIITNLLLFCFIFLTSKLLYKNLRYLQNKIILSLIVPIFFIGVAEQFILSFIYGDTIVLDKEKGLIYPIVDTKAILILQVFACIAVISILIIFSQLEKSINVVYTNKLLEQQAKEQKKYIQEAQIRERQTASLHHDIHNHFLVLYELLKKEEIKNALDYLSNLKDISNNISYPIKTGNIMLDSLLSGKLSIAKQKGIEIDCNIRIPNTLNIDDIDLCILFSNLIDNAINAQEKVENNHKYINIKAIQKGNIFLVKTENSCCLIKNKITEGIGISNIRTVLKKYGATLDIEYDNYIFIANMLFIISQQ